MEARCSFSWMAAGAGALLVLAVGWLMPDPRPESAAMQSQPRNPEVSVLLARLEKECDPESVSNDYVWSSNAPPTERHRREILERLHALKPAAVPEVRLVMQKPRNDEFGEMLVVIAAALGDKEMRLPAAKLMAYSPHPAVRLSAARELRKLRDPQMIEWFEFAARNDDRFVRNDGCGRTAEYYYPVRTVAELALQDLGLHAQSAH